MGGLSITGYVLEPPRVGGSNSPFTSTPNVYIYDQTAFDAAYPSNESEPRTEYCVFTKDEGDLHEATFFWTKNEVINRFDYDGQEQRFRPLYGAVRAELGELVPEPGGSNTTRLTATPPLSSDLVSYPLRVAVGSVLSGTTFPATAVATDGDFGTPAVGTVEISQETGHLNWNTADLTTYEGQTVYFQRQTFYTTDESTGNLGTVDDLLWLNPVPATGQYPLVRIGFGAFLTPIEVATEAGFTPPAGLASGTFEWALDTGRINLNETDTLAFTGTSVYSEGVVLGWAVGVSVQSFGTVGSPGTFAPVPPEDSDVYFRLPGVPLQYPETSFVDDFSTNGKRNVVEIKRSTGQVQFSYVDQLLYSAESVNAIVGDIIIERGMKLRLFRSPVDLTATDPTVKDATAFYETEGATWADPIIQSPFVFLPAIPFEEVPSTLVVRVEQGTGTWTGTLPRLDVSSPPTGYGYVLNSETRELNFARRRVDVVTEMSANAPYSSVALQDQVIFPSNLTLELQDGPAGPYQPLTLGTDAVINYNGGLVTLTHTSGTELASGAGDFSGTTLTDTDQDFVAAGVVQGDLLLVTSGSAEGIYTIDTVGVTTLTTDIAGGVVSNVPYEIRRGEGTNGREILADRYFVDIPALDPNTRVERLSSLGVAANAPRLNIPLLYIDAATTRFRFDSNTFATWVTVANDGAFTAPGSLVEGTIEASLTTGNLNFSALDLGKTVFLARTQTLGTDYNIQPGLGFIEFSERMLENEEVFLTYAVLDDDDNKVVVEERGTFIVRKELHNTAAPSSVITFNPLGRQVADDPEPQAFRGGRPQVNGEQVSFNTAASTCTFLADDQVTDALPHGATVDPSEDIFIDYYVYDAIGGEKSLTVLQPPMVGVNIEITEGDSSFTIAGDRTAEFPLNYLLRVDNEEVYLLASPSYDAGTGLTTVNLVSPQTFRSDFRNPDLAVSSGPTRTSSFFLIPAYFTTETNVFDTPPRGSNLLRISGDRTTSYVANTILHWTGGGVFDFNRVEGSTYDAEADKTEVILSSNGARQYTYGSVTLKRSVRPILASPTAVLQTSRSLLADLGFVVYRRVEGQLGEILQEPDGYRIGPTGVIAFVDPMQPSEELGIFYTGIQIYDDGRNFRASYTHSVAPTQGNGLQSQILKADYRTYIPDSTYWRVETFTNFRGELAQQYEDDAKAAVPTGGPVLENASSPKLYEQGRESVFYNEGRLANEDVVARATLKFFNDGINYLEDCLQDMDGRVVGDGDGRFLFDGNIDNPTRASFDDVTNQIDDLLKVAEPPLSIISLIPFSFGWVGTYQEAYKTANFSRFYTTYRRLYGFAATGNPPVEPETGTTILDTGFTNHRSVTRISRRLPWAVVTEKALVGTSTVEVDTTEVQEELARPEWDTVTYDYICVIQDRDGTFIHDVTTALTVASVTATSITFAGAFAADIPVGATIRHIDAYDLVFNPAPAKPFLKVYRVGFDIGTDLKEGVLTYVRPYPPFDGTFPGIPTELEIQPPGDGEPLDVFTYLNVVDTSPYRAPVFDGGTADDDNNRQFPVLTPWSEAEAASGTGRYAQELLLIDVGGAIRSITTDSFEDVGSLNAARTRITLDAGVFPAPVPKQYDLVSIRSGTNDSDFRSITAVGANYVDIAVGDAWATQEAGVDFTVTVSNTLATVAVLGVFNPVTRLTDAGALFQTANVEPGHTVVVTSGIYAGLRRQVTAVISQTQLDIEPLPGITTANYRVDDPIGTFGGTNSIHDDELVPNVAGTLAVLGTNLPPDPYNERDAIENFLDHVFEDIIVSPNGVTNSDPTLTDGSVDFIGPDPLNPLVTETDFVFIRSGTSAGIYQVATVTSQFTLDIDGTFPDTGVGINYRIVSPESVTRPTLEDLYDVLVGIDNTITSATDFQTLITTPVTVVGDAGAFARATLTTDLDDRVTDINTRVSDLNDPGGPIADISNAMSAGDKLYDRRFVWIDARINQQNGILPKKDRAVSERIEQQQKVLKQLTKLLTVGT